MISNNFKEILESLDNEPTPSRDSSVDEEWKDNDYPELDAQLEYYNNKSTEELVMLHNEEFGDWNPDYIQMYVALENNVIYQTIGDKKSPVTRGNLISDLIFL